MSAFPTLASGAKVQKPYRVDSSFLHVTNDMKCGVRFSYSRRVNPLRKFTLTYPSITDADLATLEAFFVSMRGRYGVFDYTDLDGTTYSNCRFDQDSLEVNYSGPNQSSVVLAIVQQGY